MGLFDDLKNNSNSEKKPTGERKAGKEETGKSGLDYEPLGESVTAERVAKISSVLNNGEKVLYLGRCTKIQTGTPGRRGSKSTTVSASLKGMPRYAVTPERIVGHASKITSDNEMVIDLDQIKSLDLQKKTMGAVLAIHTDAVSYYFTLGKYPRGQERKEMIRYIRKAAREARSTQETQTTPAEPTSNPAEKLVEIENLHKKGILTDEEYEEKRQKYVDKL